MKKRKLSAFYEANFTQIYRYFYYKTLSRQDAEDLTSETFLSFAQATQHNDGHIKDFTKFLYGIARNKFLEYLRRKSHGHSQYDDEIEGSANLSPEAYYREMTGYLEDMDNAQTLEEKAMVYIKHLPPAQRRVAKMRLIDKLSLQEIAKKLKKDINYVKVTQRRALRGLEKLFNDDGE